MKFSFQSSSALILLLGAPAAWSRRNGKDIEPAACANYNLPSEHEKTYHGDNVCDRAGFNNYKDKMNRAQTRKRLQANDQFSLVPNQKTTFCPLEVEDMMQIGKPRANGFDTVWFLENTSSDPVVVSFVKEDGIEYSAMNPSITPPHDDPHTVLHPGSWRAFHSFEGHVFHVRTLDPETNTLGPVVLQHRLGLIPIGQKAQDLICKAADPEPKVNSTKTIIPKTPGAKPVVETKLVRHPKFERTHHKNKKKEEVGRPCNTIDLGFRNMANCPLHGYYIARKNSTACQEKYRFHLGLNKKPTDFMWGWDSASKFEGSYVGHSFAFRSAADPSILVDTVTLQPTRVIDCPELKERAQINRATQVAGTIGNFLPLSIDGEDDSGEEPWKDTIVRLDRNVVASIFNDTQRLSLNGTARTLGPYPESGTRSRTAGVDSF